MTKTKDLQDLADLKKRLEELLTAVEQIRDSSAKVKDIAEDVGFVLLDEKIYQKIRSIVSLELDTHDFRESPDFPEPTIEDVGRWNDRFEQCYWVNRGTQKLMKVPSSDEWFKTARACATLALAERAEACD